MTTNKTVYVVMYEYYADDSCDETYADAVFTDEAKAEEYAARYPHHHVYEVTFYDT